VICNCCEDKEFIGKGEELGGYEVGSLEQGARNKEQGAKNKEQGTRIKGSRYK
jgi:hypothetical protein